jgi:hypothetical protein
MVNWCLYSGRGIVKLSKSSMELTGWLSLLRGFKMQNAYTFLATQSDAF